MKMRKFSVLSVSTHVRTLHTFFINFISVFFATHVDGKLSRWKPRLRKYFIATSGEFSISISLMRSRRKSLQCKEENFFFQIEKKTYWKMTKMITCYGFGVSTYTQFKKVLLMLSLLFEKYIKRTHFVYVDVAMIHDT